MLLLFFKSHHHRQCVQTQTDDDLGCGSTAVVLGRMRLHILLAVFQVALHEFTQMHHVRILLLLSLDLWPEGEVHLPNVVGVVKRQRFTI